MDNDTVHVHVIGEREDVFKALAWDGESFLIMNQMQDILRADLRNESVLNLRINNKMLENFFPFSVVMGDEVWFITNVDGNIVKIEHGSVISDELEVSSYKQGETEDQYIMVKKIEEKKLAFFSILRNELYIFEQGKGMKISKLLWKDALEKYYMQYSIDKCHIECEFDSGLETYFENIKAFIEYIKTNNSGVRNREKKCNNGEYIYKFLLLWNQ